MSATMVPEQDTKPDQGADDAPVNDIEAAMSRALAPVVARATTAEVVIGGGSSGSAEPDAPLSPAVAEPIGAPEKQGASAPDADEAAAPSEANGDAEPSEVAKAMPGPNVPANKPIQSKVDASREVDEPTVDSAPDKDADKASAETAVLGNGSLSPANGDKPEPGLRVDDKAAPEASADQNSEPAPTNVAEIETATEAAPDDSASPLIAPVSGLKPDDGTDAMPEPQEQRTDETAAARQDDQAAAEPEPAFVPSPSPEAPEPEPDDASPTSRANQLASAIVATAAARRRPEQITSDRESDPEPARANLPMTQIRNRVFDHLVEGDDDVIGMITYSLYKQDKRDWLLNWMSQHGNEPTSDQMEVFVNAQLSVAQRERYRNAARQVLDAYASVAVDMEKPVIVREALAGRVEEAAKKAEGASRWWRQLGLALLGGTLAAGIVIGLVAILVAFGVDVAGYLGFESGIDL